MTQSRYQTSKAQYMFQYFLKVVSTQFRTLNAQKVCKSAPPLVLPLTDNLAIFQDHNPSIQYDPFRT